MKIGGLIITGYGGQSQGFIPPHHAIEALNGLSGRPFDHIV